MPELKLINLVAGKNNAGKTALLEALTIVGSRDKTGTIKAIAKKRKYRLEYQDLGERLPLGEANISGGIDIFEINNFTVSAEMRGYGIKYKNGEQEKTTIDGYEIPDVLLRSAKPVVFVPSQSTYSVLSSLWSRVALTDLEDDVLAILTSTMNKLVSRLSITEDEILIREMGGNKPYNIEALGEGAKRILLVALSLVNSKDGLLLIDEIETHLHHSVIRKLWKIIFEYAIKWNIQVVATTHSQDAIREFWYEATENEAYQEICQVLRLQISREGKHEVIQYPFKRLDAVLEMEMEIR